MNSSGQFELHKMVVMKIGSPHDVNRGPSGHNKQNPIFVKHVPSPLPFLMVFVIEGIV